MISRVFDSRSNGRKREMISQNHMLKQYYYLTKSGIVWGNTLAAFAGFLFASRWNFGVLLLLATLIGIALIVASACVFNNYIDRDIDRKMARTKHRALASGVIPTIHALLYASVLGLLGMFLLSIYVNVLTAGVATLGFIFYVGLYSVEKRRSHWGVIVGSVAGAVPIVVGYTAVTNQLDAPALILFLILALWQMPHFYAIAIYRFDDYVAAKIPTLPIQKGMKTTKRAIAFYILAFVAATSALTIFSYAGYFYLALMLTVGIVWFIYGIYGFIALDTVRWARKLFFLSLVVLILFFIAVSVGPLLS